jgi:hypothetical protein
MPGLCGVMRSLYIFYANQSVRRVQAQSGDGLLVEVVV